MSLVTHAHAHAHARLRSHRTLQLTQQLLFLPTPRSDARDHAGGATASSTLLRLSSGSVQSSMNFKLGKSCRAQDWLRYGLLLRTAHVVIRRSDDVAVACPIGIATVDSAGRVSALRNTVQTLGREGRRCYVVLCYVRTQLSKSRLHSTRQAARSAAGARAQSHGRQGPRQARPHAVLAQCRRAQR